MGEYCQTVISILLLHTGPFDLFTNETLDPLHLSLEGIKYIIMVRLMLLLFIAIPIFANSDIEGPSERLAFAGSIIFDNADDRKPSPEAPVGLPETSAQQDQAKEKAIQKERQVKKKAMLETYTQYSDSAEHQAKIAIATVGGSAAAASVLSNAESVFPTLGYVAAGGLILVGLLGLAFLLLDKDLFDKTDRAIGLFASGLLLAYGVVSLFNPILAGTTLFQILLVAGGVASLILGVTAFVDYLKARHALKEAKLAEPDANQ